MGSFLEIKTIMASFVNAFSLTIFLAANLVSVAQTGNATISTEKVTSFDTSMIVDYSKKLNIYVYTINKFRNLNIKNNQLNKRLKYEPIGRTNLGIGFNYKWMGIGIAYNFPFMNTENDRYTETNQFDVQLNIFSRSWGFSGYIQNYKGFYLSNAEDFAVNTEEQHPYLEDLQSASFGLDAFYYFNYRKFSYKAAFMRTERQKKGAGSFMLGAFFKSSNVSAPSGFVVKELPDTLSKHFNLDGYTTFISGVSFGYVRTFLFFKRCFFSLSLVPGIGIRNLLVSNIDQDDIQIKKLAGNFNFKMSLGYEGKRLYLGASSIISSESAKYETVDIAATTGQGRFYIGKRFNLGKKASKSSVQNL